MYENLEATKRKEIGDFARAYAKHLREDEGVEYDGLIEIILSKLEPQSLVHSQKDRICTEDGRVYAGVA